MQYSFIILALFTAPVFAAQGGNTALDLGYRHMYNLRFDQAHRCFQDWERLNPDDPMGPVSDAAAYLFAEFDRFHILQSEFFVNDPAFKHLKKITPDAATKRSFDDALERTRQLADRVLASSPQDSNALFASILRFGLRSDYLALIDKRYMSSLSDMKSSRALAERLLAVDPQCYDAYLAVGIENYLLSLKPAPLRWLLRAGGARTDKDEGIRKLRLTAEKGRLLMPFARLLLAVAALRDRNQTQARELLDSLAREFPGNPLYTEELARLSGREQNAE